MSSTYDPIFGCELVTSRLDKDGYAYHGKSRAHIVAWVKANGAVPLDADGKPKPLDHLCRRRNCKAPHHLEPVTKRENELRKKWEYRAARKKCARGHAMADAIVTPEMGRLCRTCHLEASGKPTTTGKPQATPPGHPPLTGAQSRSLAGGVEITPENPKRKDPKPSRSRDIELSAAPKLRNDDIDPLLRARRASERVIMAIEAQTEALITKITGSTSYDKDAGSHLAWLGGQLAAIGAELRQQRKAERREIEAIGIDAIVDHLKSLPESERVDIARRLTQSDAEVSLL